MRKLAMALVIVLSMLCSTVFSSAANPAVVLVNPVSNSIVYSNNLLISVKLTEPTKIKVTVFEEKQMVNGTWSAVNVNTLTTTGGSLNEANFRHDPVAPAAEYTSDNNLSFYTKKVNVSPGLYQIRIETIENGKVVSTKSSYVAVKEKTTEEDSKAFETPQSGTMQFLQNLFKNIFGD